MKRKTTATLPNRELRITDFARGVIITNHDRVVYFSRISRASQLRVKRMSLKDELERKYTTFRIISA